MLQSFKFSIRKGNAANAANDFPVLQDVCRELVRELKDHSNLSVPILTYLKALSRDPTRWPYVCDTLKEISADLHPDNLGEAEARRRQMALSGKLPTRQASGVLEDALGACPTAAAAYAILEDMIQLSANVPLAEAHLPLARLLEVTRPGGLAASLTYRTKGFEYLRQALDAQTPATRIESCQELLPQGDAVSDDLRFRTFVVGEMMQAANGLNDHTKRRVMASVVLFVPIEDRGHLVSARNYLDSWLKEQSSPKKQGLPLALHLP